jgi:hypothetical protein
MVNVIKQREWTEPELRDQGFDQYARRKQLVMVRPLPRSESPKGIVTSSGERLIALSGDMICYIPGDHIRPTFDRYNHWPVEPAIFNQTYHPWDEWDWQPSPAEQYLKDLGCKPYYKIAQVWAKKLDQAVYVQSLEQNRPQLVKQGSYVVIGSQGEPYSMDSHTFIQRYYPHGMSAFWKRVQQLFKPAQKQGGLYG